MEENLMDTIKSGKYGFQQTSFLGKISKFTKMTRQGRLAPLSDQPSSRPSSRWRP